MKHILVLTFIFHLFILLCIFLFASFILNSTQQQHVWHGMVLTHTHSVKTNLSDEGANSTLFVARVNKSDSGNYTCTIGPTLSFTTNVHVLNGKWFSLFFFLSEMFTFEKKHTPCLSFDDECNSWFNRNLDALCDRYLNISSVDVLWYWPVLRFMVFL